MPSKFFFFRPILDAHRNWSALDWQPESPINTDPSDILKCFTQAAAAPLASSLPLVVPVTPEILEQNAFVTAFDASQVVLVLPESSLENEPTMALCKRLHSRGYRIALKIGQKNLLHRVPLDAFDHLYFEAAFARHELPAIDLTYAGQAGFRKIASDVSSYEMFGWLAEKGFDWCDSHFLTTANPSRGKEPDLARLKLLKLLNLVKQDGDTRDIEAVFREEPKLSYNLLRLVNSVAVGARVKISSFSQAIAILGRRQLQRWLQLLVYANNLSDGHAPNPLMQLAAARGRQLELLSAVVEPIPDIPELSDNAFMAGLFSLLGILINLPMREILKEVPLQDEVVNALNNSADGGVLGLLLSAVIAAEAGNFSAAGRILSSLGISPAIHAKSQVTAFYWASRINAELHD